jgi:hypothetical protein
LALSYILRSVLFTCIDRLECWLKQQLAVISKGSTLADAIRYGLNHWAGPVPLPRRRSHRDRLQYRRALHEAVGTELKNALFAGSDEGADNWACVASLVESCKLNDVNPHAHAWMTDTLTKLVNRWSASRVDELMPWAYAKAAPTAVNV